MQKKIVSSASADNSNKKCLLYQAKNIADHLDHKRKQYKFQNYNLWCPCTILDQAPLKWEEILIIE